ncbi:SMI1/KNR4 family protein [Archangium sp.]|uniref:SMI1/KNR4 family protein n=1 Tax=Archangium sp. TaxID=1872627 RepID=UPI0039C86BC9
MPEGIYPFGDTPGGEYLCFDFRGSLQQPRIVLVTIEATIHPVANSFQDLMEGLHD